MFCLLLQKEGKRISNTGTISKYKETEIENNRLGLIKFIIKAKKNAISLTSLDTKGLD